MLLNKTYITWSWQCKDASTLVPFVHALSTKTYQLGIMTDTERAAMTFCATIFKMVHSCWYCYLKETRTCTFSAFYSHVEGFVCWTGIENSWEEYIIDFIVPFNFRFTSTAIFFVYLFYSALVRREYLKGLHEPHNYFLFHFCFQGKCLKDVEPWRNDENRERTDWFTRLTSFLSRSINNNAALNAWKSEQALAQETC